MKKRPIAVFDIDGTIFRSSLLIELNDKLVRKGIFPETAKDKILKAKELWLNRQGKYTDYLNLIISVYMHDIKGVAVTAIRRCARELIAEQKNRVYVFTRDLIKTLRKTHTLIIISFSPLEAVEAFQRSYRFDILSGTRYLSRRGRFTGAVEHRGTLPDKRTILKKIIAEHGLSLEGSVGVGDTESDIGFLSTVSRPIAFNPNKKLYDHARLKGWKIAVERKDVIYVIAPGRRR